ncbi:hypothetical protein TSAR_005018 [Trichomalopsis sarcophagae]|uniref:Uncharacterized protein n=1 Tax=Trichomalopsis sarcophagae TaxID=543379 RepID=A0A232FAF5_9HYME|nr:hypothetical protein TSAR_005018 [Trichomalopsis sarcophagae]
MMETQNYWEDSSAHSMQVKYERLLLRKSAAKKKKESFQSQPPRRYDSGGGSVLLLVFSLHPLSLSQTETQIPKGEAIEPTTAESEQHTTAPRATAD